ncbi:hypothetical protein PFISCL1PPCAC_12216, partial [Pristionchus fissidentatus]
FKHLYLFINGAKYNHNSNNNNQFQLRCLNTPKTANIHQKLRNKSIITTVISSFSTLRRFDSLNTVDNRLTSGRILCTRNCIRQFLPSLLQQALLTRTNRSTTKQRSNGDGLSIDVSDEGKRGEKEMGRVGGQSKHRDVTVNHFHLQTAPHSARSIVAVNSSDLKMNSDEYVAGSEGGIGDRAARKNLHQGVSILQLDHRLVLG